MAVEDIILSSEVASWALSMIKREELLKKHKYDIYQGKDGKWYTYLPGRKKLKRTSRDLLVDALVSYYDTNRITLQEFFTDWNDRRAELNKINWFGSSVSEIRSHDISKPVERLYDRREKLLRYMEIVEQSAIDADPDIFEWLLRSVTEGVSYGSLEVPCGRDYFYDRYRKFFWLLDKVRE